MLWIPSLDVTTWLMIGFTLLATLAAAWLVSTLLTRWGRGLAARSQTRLDDALLGALHGPAVIAVVLVGVWLTLQEARLTNEFWRTLFFVLYLALGYVAATRLVTRLIDWYGHEVSGRTETTFDDHILPFLRRVATVIIFLTALVMLLARFNINVSAFVATLGIGSLAVALAGQEVLSNMISGFIIIIDQPFRIGDRIELEELDTWGDVQDIGLHRTRILTRDNRLVSVPNALIGKSRVINHSIPSTQFRVQTHVEVAYGTDVEHARQVMIEAVRRQDWVMPGKPVEALFLEFGESGLVFRVRCWIEHYVETRRIMDKLNTALYNALNEAGIEIPFPQRVVHLQSRPKGDAQ